MLPSTGPWTSVKTTNKPPRGCAGRTPRSIFWRIACWIPVAAFVTAHFCSIGNITGGSMSPTFNGPFAEASAANSRSDVVLLNRLAAAKGKFKVGDIVVLISPLDPNQLLTKRIIALQGDVVRVWAPDATGRGGKWTRLKVPPGHVWIEGDAAVDIVPGSLGRTAGYGVARNGPMAKGKSRDSREFGPVPVGLITARIDAILWPPKRFGRPAPRPVPSDQAMVSKHQYPPSLSETSALAAQQFDEDERLRSIATQVHPSLARILDEMESRVDSARVKAHPQDSRLSPYVDWTDGSRIDADGDETRKQGGGRRAVPTADGAASSGRDGKQGAGMRRYWNAMSRGGSLGDDAED
ncbi:related to inner mitochondrial membrane peptidase 2 [Pseudozyma flocculosa]|uniref:Related to inner mitochondrial membrane peptidase 2 n=1 Tax=Pseudozyma flocculosa TaxID=84751 RepID=A0A5C3F9K5_9BASI|nr:related to inner mitochondrial membrane peptidase 2 [Pseudozyma flocculosa]